MAAGALACLIALPVTPVTLLVATVMKQSLYRKVMHVSVAYTDLQRHGREALIANAAVAGATGLIAACIAGWIALALVKRDRTSAFFAIAGLGATLASVVVRHVMTRHGDPAGSVTLAVLLAWLFSLAGLYLATAMTETVDHPLRR